MPDRRSKTSPENGKKGGGQSGQRLQTRLRAAAAQQHAELTAETIVEQIARGALYDPGEFLDAEGNFRPLHELTEAQRQCIQGIEFVMKNATAGDGAIDRILKLKLANRDKYVEMGAKYHSLLVDKLEANVNVQGIGARLDQARERAAKK